MKMTLKKRVEFLEALARTGSVTKAAQAVGVSRTRLYKMKKQEAAFGRAWDRQLVWSERLFDVEERAIRRAELGSDSMIRFVLKDYAPRLQGVDGLEGEIEIEPRDGDEEFAAQLAEFIKTTEKQPS